MSEQGYQLQPLRNAVSGHVGGGTPSRQVPSFWCGNIPWASVKDFSEQSGVISDTEEHISQAGLNASASNLIPAGIPLVCTRMAVGRAAMPSVPIAINQDVKALFPVTGVSSEYLLKLLQFIQSKTEAQAVGSTVKGIRVQDYLDIKVPLADVDVQPVIARILDTLDTAILETEAIIAKLKAVKQGLLHDLLTRGLDENGELRPPQSEAPHLYKDSPLGWIPKEWDVVDLTKIAPLNRSVIRTGPFGSSLKGEHWREYGRPVVTIGAISGGVWNKKELLFIDEFTANIMHEFALKIGDVVFSRVADVGQCIVITSKENNWIMSSNLMRISLDNSLANPNYIQKLLSSSIPIRKLLRSKINSAGRDVANSSTLMSLHFPLPTIEEQDEILCKTDCISVRIETEDSKLNKLLRLKNALMDDLLTGRVRVTPLLDAAETAPDQAP